TITWYCAGTTSSRCERSSPITCIVPPQHGQAVSSGSTTISTRGRCSGSGPRPARRLCERVWRSAGTAFSCSAAQSVVLAGELIALFDEMRFLGPLGIPLGPGGQHQDAQRRNIVGEGIGRRHAR